MKDVALYHVVYANEDFNHAAESLFKLIQNTETKRPGANRILYLDIKGHRNKEGGFDHDMFELQHHFILGFLFQYLHEVNMPLISVKNPQKQNNDIPEALQIKPNDGLTAKYEP